VAPADHLVVFDAPDDFPATAAKLGFTTVETLSFHTLVGYRVRVPNNDSAGAIAILKTRYPSATVDTETTEDFTPAN
jgi:hypothetical protein